MYPVRRRVAPAIRCGPGEPGGDTDPTAHKVPVRVCDMRHRRLFGHTHANQTEALRSAASFLDLSTAARHAAGSRGGGDDDDAYDAYETYDELSTSSFSSSLASVLCLRAHVHVHVSGKALAETETATHLPHRENLLTGYERPEREREREREKKN